MTCLQAYLMSEEYRKKQEKERNLSIGKIEFNLPEEIEEFNLAMGGSKLASQCIEFDNKFLRAVIKYGDCSYSQRLSELIKDETYTNVVLEVVEIIREIYYRDILNHIPT